MYLKGGHFDLAAQLAEEMGDYAAASQYYVDAGDLKAAGEAELQLDNLEAAARLFSRAGQHTRAGEIFESLDQFEAAAMQFEQASYREKAAGLYAKAGDHLRAVELLEGLIASIGRDEFGSRPSEAERSRILSHRRMCGNLLLRANLPERAAKQFEAALCLEQAADAWRRAGNVDQAVDILLRLQKPQEAVAVLEAAGRDLSSLSPAVQAAILTRQGQFREAAELMERVGSRYQAAETWAKAGEHGRAARLLEREGDVDQASAHYIKAGEHAEAARLRETSREYGHAADLYRQAGLPENAARVLLKAGDPVGAAMIHYELKDFGAVIKALQTVEKGQPAYRKASFLLGRVFADQGLHTLAVERFLTAVDGREVGRETALTFYMLAQAHEGSGRPREAAAIYRRILSFDYHYKDVHARLRAVADKLGSEPEPDRADIPIPEEDRPAQQKRYRIEKSLGVGRLGEVFLAIDTVLERPVAFRLLHESPGEPGMAIRFLKEAAATARLSHPNILTTYDTGIDKHDKFIVSELAQGRSLRELLDQRVRFEVNRVVEIGRQILEALDHAHRREILHRNLCPENVFVTEDDRVAIGDFGLAVRLSDLPREELAGGRPIQYKAPEQLLRKRVDERSDLYTVGIMLYEMAVGHPPFQGTAVAHQHVNEPVPEPRHGERPLPAFLRRVILRCLEKEPPKRYANARAVLEDLEIREIVPGMVVANRYEVLAEVGRGGMGAVFRARDIEIDETVALKFLSGENSSEMTARQVHEIKTTRKVIHPNVVRVFTLERWGEHRFIVMEYIDGVPLTRWMERAPTPTREDRLRVAIQAAQALDAAHRAGVVHRDVKPENILINASGEAKVLDFGIARPEGTDQTRTASGMVLGSPMYLSPEAIHGRPMDRRSDIYALGAVLYLLFTGSPAFPGKDAREILMKHLHTRPRPPHELDPSLPRALSETILRALDPDPERRFSSASILAHRLAGQPEPSSLSTGRTPA